MDNLSNLELKRYSTVLSTRVLYVVNYEYSSTLNSIGFFGVYSIRGLHGSITVLYFVPVFSLECWSGTHTLWGTSTRVLYSSNRLLLEIGEPTVSTFNLLRTSTSICSYPYPLQYSNEYSST
jgi:hypothetical protein